MHIAVFILMRLRFTLWNRGARRGSVGTATDHDHDRGLLIVPLLQGVFWGSAAAVVLQWADNVNALLITLMVASTAATVTVTLLPHRWAGTLFAAALLLPMAGALSITYHPLLLHLSFASLPFVVQLFATAYRRHTAAERLHGNRSANQLANPFAAIPLEKTRQHPGASHTASPINDDAHHPIALPPSEVTGAGTRGIGSDPCRGAPS